MHIADVSLAFPESFAGPEEWQQQDVSETSARGSPAGGPGGLAGESQGCQGARGRRESGRA